MLAALVQVAQTVGSAVAPAAAPVAEDPRGALELLIQAVGAVGVVIGGAVILRQLIYKQFGDDYPVADFRKGMLKGGAWFVLGTAIIVVSLIFGSHLR
jgi:hypothetical protein